MHHAGGDVEAFGFGPVASERPRSVREAEAAPHGHEDDVGAVVVTIGHERDAVESRDSAEVSGERKVAVSDHHLVEAGASNGRDAEGHSVVQPGSRSPQHGCTFGSRPIGHIVIVTDHEHGQCPGRPHHSRGQIASQRRTVGLGEHGRQALFGVGESPHGDQDGDGHGRSLGFRPMDVVRVAVIGAGSWGTTVASLAAQNSPTKLWARRPEIAVEIDRDKRNSRYLPDFTLDSRLQASSEMCEVVGDADVVVMGVPSHGFRETLAMVAPYVRPLVPIVSLAKGLEQETDLRMTEVIADVLPGHPAGVLTGPNLSKEILAGHGAAAVIAMTDDVIAERLQRVFATDNYRVYTNDDVIGSEVAGALKNIIAVAAGIAAGLGTGDNTLASLLTRGLDELTRLGVAMGGRPATFAGLAGMGDLVATCISSQSRNRYVGLQLAAGRRIDDIVAEMRQIAEGVKTVPVARNLARRYGVEMPITDEMYEVIIHGRSADDAYRELMRRKLRPEVRGA